ncbi:VanZ family protein [Haloarchaeobius sp. HRN-SO-5]|uniref:VanZ family protein n=1 Tax=Haloarchaeobius sp. HRN-SO-5 TaxID=3446118 RepID=UPI003EB999E6
MKLDGPGRWTRGNRRWLPAVCWTVVLVGGSLVTPPGQGTTPLGPFGLVGLDKYAHAFGYAVLGGFVSLAVRPRSWRGVVLAVALTAGVGAGVEVAQAFVPARSTALADGVANTVGAALGLAVWWVLTASLDR